MADNVTPRGLSASEAAKYVGLSKSTFLSEVGAGVWPQPFRLSDGEKSNKRKKKLWDRKALDKYLDKKSGFAEQSSSRQMIKDALNAHKNEVRRAS